MPVTPADVIPIADLVPQDMVGTAAQTCAHLLPHIVDRSTLHPRDSLERFGNLLMGEIAELAVIAYLRQHGKHAMSAVDKTAQVPDAGHDVVVRRVDGSEALCSVKSSISHAFDIPRILTGMRPAFTRHEPRDVNIQVYYHYRLGATPRTTIPALNCAYIIGWVAEKELLRGEFAVYQGERRKVSEMKLQDARTMAELLTRLT